MGKYHPHGDSAIYDALVRMAQSFSMGEVLIDGQGNFGSIDGDSAAAMRYTEVKLSSITENILSDIDKDTVDRVDIVSKVIQKYGINIGESGIKRSILKEMQGTIDQVGSISTLVVDDNLPLLVDKMFTKKDDRGKTLIDKFFYQLAKQNDGKKNDMIMKLAESLNTIKTKINLR